jgi:predicted RNA polymerase sigma factor
MSEGGAQARSTADAVARRSYGKLVAFLAARTRDVAAAEDALSEAFAAALADWPKKGCPANPEAWLLTAARRKLIDFARRRQSGATAAADLQILLTPENSCDPLANEYRIPDDRLALMFACAHPAIDAGIRAPLILQVILGLDAAAIASAFLMSPTTMGQRLVRAKNKIREAGIPFSIPESHAMGGRFGRLETVLDAIYAAFAEGWTDPAGTDPARRDLSGEALFLGRLVTELLPQEPEALGLLSLMLHADARRRARRDESGEYVPLAEQKPALWDADMIDEAESLLWRASRLVTAGSAAGSAAGSTARVLIGRFQLEAALQSAHVHRRRSGVANWEAVVQLYDALHQLSGSPVVAINRALAVAELRGPKPALDELDRLAGDARLTEYQPYWAARARLLAQTGGSAEARAAYEIAIGLERDAAVRRFLRKRQAEVSEHL